MSRLMLAAAVVAAIGVGWFLVPRGDDDRPVTQRPDEARFQKVLLEGPLGQPMRIAVAPDRRVLLIERTGTLKVWDPKTEKTMTAGKVRTATVGESGLIGLALAPDFDRTGHIYLNYARARLREVVHRARLAFHARTRQPARPAIRDEDHRRPTPSRLRERARRWRSSDDAARRSVHRHRRQHPAAASRVVTQGSTSAEGRSSATPGAPLRTRTRRSARSSELRRSLRAATPSPPGTSSMRPQTARTRPSPRSSRWGSVTRSSSATTTLRRVRCGWRTTARTRSSLIRSAAPPGT